MVTAYSLEVVPQLPEALSGLQRLAGHLMYSWERDVRALYYRLDRQLWEACGHNPTVFLRRVDQKRLDAALDDPVFMLEYRRVLAACDAYLAERPVVPAGPLETRIDHVAYFCFEFGLHESLPLYSGGLGILAGDHCKACSDLGVPLVAVGLMYRQGYFLQEIDQAGAQVARYVPSRLADLPVWPVLAEDGQRRVLSIPLPGRSLYFQVWEVRIGRVALYLLDTDIDDNSPEDRAIAYQLYGGDRAHRLRQEMLLGIGGVRVLRSMNITPTVWHLNEGHAAFCALERWREAVVDHHMNAEAALEWVAASTVFTTHTPVPAGHDVFDHALFAEHFSWMSEAMGISLQSLLEAGASPLSDHGVNMTALALRFSRFHNGVSRIHGNVAARMEAYIWPEIPAEENPLRHVTNGVHVPTFLAGEWASLFDLHFGSGWRAELLNADYWHRIDHLPPHACWSVRQSLKARLRDAVHRRLGEQWRRNGYSESQTRHRLAPLCNTRGDVLILGFARRFATYKRAMLIFSDLERAARLFNDPHRPVLMIFAGKAHPEDVPARQLIMRLHEISLMPEFFGKVLLVENYDIALARKLVAGADVWINTPAFPQEASGTSGQKAAINGGLNVSVLDGWWAEAWNGRNGWGITPHGEEFSEQFRDREEARELLDVLEHEVIPLYFEHNGLGYSQRWIERSRSAMQSVLPRFNAGRMVMDYVNGFYRPAARHGVLLGESGGAHAVTLADWKSRVRARWSGVELQRLDSPVGELHRDQMLGIDVAVALNGLHPQDISMDCLFGRGGERGRFHRFACKPFQFLRYLEDGRALYRLTTPPPAAGLVDYRIRAYPWHELSGQRFEVGLMKWL